MSGWEAVLVISSLAATAVSTAGAIQQGQAARKAAGYQAALAENNAIAARQQAEFEERQHREKARQLMSAQRTKAAKGGVLPEEGSPLLFNIDTGEEGEIGALNIRRGGDLRVRGFQSEAAFGRYQGRLAQQKG